MDDRRQFFTVSDSRALPRSLLPSDPASPATTNELHSVAASLAIGASSRGGGKQGPEGPSICGRAAVGCPTSRARACVRHQHLLPSPSKTHTPGRPPRGGPPIPCWQRNQPLPPLRADPADLASQPHHSVYGMLYDPWGDRDVRSVGGDAFEGRVGWIEAPGECHPGDCCRGGSSRSRCDHPVCAPQSGDHLVDQAYHIDKGVLSVITVSGRSEGRGFAPDGRGLGIDGMASERNQHAADASISAISDPRRLYK